MKNLMVQILNFHLSCHSATDFAKGWNLSIRGQKSATANAKQTTCPKTAKSKTDDTQYRQGISLQKSFQSHKIASAEEMQSVPRNDMRKKIAFSLAEVLTTLMVIGFIAVIVIPIMYQNYQKGQTETRLKMVYSRLEQAVKLASAEMKDYTIWNYQQSNKDIFEEYLLKHINIVGQRSSDSLFKDKVLYKEISGKQESKSDGGLWLLRSPVEIYTVVNGTEIIICKTDYYNPTFAGNAGMSIMVDLNGTKKKPNQFGKDAFIIGVSKKRGICFSGDCGDSNEYTIPNGVVTRNILTGKSRPNYTNGYNYKYACNKNERGMWCGALIKMDGYKIKSDYPW